WFFPWRPWRSLRPLRSLPPAHRLAPAHTSGTVPHGAPKTLLTSSPPSRRLESGEPRRSPRAVLRLRGGPRADGGGGSYGADDAGLRGRLRRRRALPEGRRGGAHRAARGRAGDAGPRREQALPRA